MSAPTVTKPVFPHPDLPTSPLEPTDVSHWSTSSIDKGAAMKDALTPTTKHTYVLRPGKSTVRLEELDSLALDIPDIEIIRKETYQALHKLTPLRTPRAIASHLLKEDIIGTPRTPQDCPIANFLSRATGYDLSVGELVIAYEYDYVSRDTSVFSGIGYARLHHVTQDVISVPRVIRQFVRAFDRGIYPELESKTGWLPS